MMQQNAIQNNSACLNNLKLLKLEAEKIMKILDNFEKLEELAKPMMKESYLNLLNQRNNFNQEVVKIHREGKKK